MTQERRGSARLGMRLPATLTDVRSAAVQRAFTQNVSGKGLGFLTDALHELGTQGAVELKLPGLKAPLSFRVEVVWSRPTTDPTHRLNAPKNGR